jgi:hypothetical protein
VSVPPWWAEGQEVVGKDGARGTLHRDPDGAWRVQLAASSAYVIHPDPKSWFVRVQFDMGQSELKRLLYEIDRVFLVSRGRGGLLDWASIPDRLRLQDDPRPAPLETDGFAAIRREISDAVTKALAPYVR